MSNIQRFVKRLVPLFSPHVAACAWSLDEKNSKPVVVVFPSDSYSVRLILK